MKHLIHIIIAFILWVWAGAYRGRNTVQTKAVEIATKAYEWGIESLVASWSAAVNAQVKSQVDELKKEGKEYIKEELKKQVDGFFN